MCYMYENVTSKVVGVRELRQNLSIYLDRVKKGEALTVTEHGEAVAILRPLPHTFGLLGRIVADGRATAPTRALADRPRALRVKLDRPLSAILEEQRGERL